MTAPTTTAATPEELAEACIAGMDGCTYRGRVDAIAAAIRQHSEAQRAEIERLTKERDEALADLRAANIECRRLEEDAGATEAALAKEEATCLQIIDQRDTAEKALSDLFAMVTGRPPEWSNLFGYSEALDECADALSASLERERAMREALNVACKWGIAAPCWDGAVAGGLRDWIAAGCTGPFPADMLKTLAIIDQEMAAAMSAKEATDVR